MPKQAMNYANAVIYKIVCNDLTITDCYVGSTTNFTKRKHQHKSDCKSRNLKIYQTIRANGDWDNWVMALVEEFPTTSKLLLDQRERYWIETLNANLNCQIPARTLTEYYQVNKEQFKIQQKQYYETNKVQIAERHKQYNIDNKDKLNVKIACECGCVIIKKQLKRHQNTNKHIDAMAQLHSSMNA
jgi:hypothetical protein